MPLGRRAGAVGSCERSELETCAESTDVPIGVLVLQGPNPILPNKTPHDTIKTTYMMPESLPWILYVLQIAIALGLVNVWLLRYCHATRYRGAGAQNMREEFAVYGLPAWSVYIVGFLKLTIATIMVVVTFVPDLVRPLGVPSLGLLVLLMLGAISMHIKVKDPVIKALPATAMLVAAISALYLIGLLA